MNKILHGLYNGNIVPWERNNPDSEKQCEIFRKIESEEKYFSEILSPVDFKRLQDLSRLHSEILAEEEADIFSYGFTLGFLLTNEITEEAKQIFTN